jgi:hypothetical protein
MTKLCISVWSLGILYWILRIISRSVEFLADGHLSIAETFHLFVVFLLFAGWIYLRPESRLELAGLNAKDISTLKYYKLDSVAPPHQAYLNQTETRMLQLDEYHLISQEYVLPIPYLCQIYHLLNLKHLESVHSFSLNGLKVADVSQLEATAIGGSIKFKTILNSSLNILRIWRQPVVEVELTLHTPYTIELKIPIYSDKKIVVMFNILPLGNDAHKLFIDMYSNLVFPKPIFQVFLHCASCLTLLEDLPYLHKLANGNLRQLAKGDQASSHKTMQLFKQFVELYGSSLEQSQAIGAVELRPISEPSG